MGMKTENVDIDGASYQITQLPFSRANTLLVRLVKVVGPAVANGLSGIQDMNKALDTDVMKLATSLPDLVSTLCEKLTAGDLQKTFEELAGSCTVSTDGKQWLRLKDVMEVHFAGDHVHAFKWLAAALKVNYGNFLSALRARAAAQREDDRKGEQ